MDQKKDGGSDKLQVSSTFVAVLALVVGICIGNLMPSFSGIDQSGKAIDSQRSMPISSMLEKVNAVVLFQATEQDLQAVGVKPNITENLMINGNKIPDDVLNQIFGTTSPTAPGIPWMRCQNNYSGSIDNTWIPDCSWAWGN